MVCVGGFCAYAKTLYSHTFETLSEWENIPKFIGVELELDCQQGICVIR